MTEEREVVFFDTTLRDGEQSPGVALTPEEKVQIARALARLGVQVIEAGFPVASPGDYEGVQRVAAEVEGPVICALARCHSADIQRAAQALAPARRSRLHVFIATSPIHMQYKIRKTPAEVLRQAEESVREARPLAHEVEFSAEDATRSDRVFLAEVFSAAIAAGADVINVPDTVGYTTPAEFAELIRYLREHVAGIDQVVLSVHCHNDLGLAVANTLAALEAGATQVEGTINGIGERAGNTALEEVIMAIRTRHERYPWRIAIRTEEIMRTSQLVSTLTGMVVQPNKAVVGANAFAHEAGIHQDGILKERTTYEIMRPESVGLRESRLVLGKHSGRHAFVEKLKSLGFDLPPEDVDAVFARFKELADRKQQITDQDLEALVRSERAHRPDVLSLVDYRLVTGSQTPPSAEVTLVYDGRTVSESATGDGPVDAIFRAIDRAVPHGGKLEDYSLRAVTGGPDALGEAHVKVSFQGQVFYGHGVSTDVLEASARAYLDAVDRLLRHRQVTVDAPGREGNA